MRLLIIYIMCVLSAPPVFSAQREKRAMVRIAQRALQGEPVNTRAAGDGGDVSLWIEKEYVAVFQSEGGRIAVVTADDRFPEVIGLSDGAVRGDLPDALQWWLASVDRQIGRAVARAGESTRGVDETLPDAVEPFVKTAWGQTAPFNAKCPTKVQNGESKPCKVGCVALAMGQVMRYYGHPHQGTGSKSYGLTQRVSADFASTTYLWESMPERAGTEWSQQETDAVGTLLFHCGVAVSTMYGLATSTVIRNQSIPEAMVAYFGYDAVTIRYLDRANYDDSTWKSIIRQELAEARPVIYTGNSATYGGHAFVLDGYNSAGDVHVNWGWFGNGNGFYNIDLIEPGVDFNQKQAMVVGIRPGGSAMKVEDVLPEDGARRVVGIYDLLGRRVGTSHCGMAIVKYSDGAVAKVLLPMGMGR